MNAISIIEDFQRRGIVLLVAAGKLQVDAPRGVLTPELLAELKARKPELLAVLTGHQPAEPVQAPQSNPAPVSAISPAFVHVACSACVHLDGGRCTKRGFFPIFPHIAMRLCGDYEVNP